jgi:proline iminopeptidase
MKRLFSLIALCTLLTCRESVYNEGDFFYLINKGAEMPIIVRGNKASGVFVLFIHGGPGGTAIQKIGLPVFNQLEQHYATVFWDQRGSGSSQGNSPDDLLTLDQFVEDLDKVVDLLQYKYNNPEIFLFGHSWGGCLGTAYLTDQERQRKIKGWIEVDGAHNNPKGDSLSLQFVTDYAVQQIDSNKDVSYWNYALGWYARNPNFTSDQLEHYAFLEKAHGYVHDPNIKRDPKTFPEYTTTYLFNSPADVTAELTNYNHVIKHFIISDIDLTPQMKSITLPALLMWGEYDGVIPYPMAQQAFFALGTIAAQKSITQLPNAAHFSFYEDPDLCANTIIGFVEKYR